MKQQFTDFRGVVWTLAESVHNKHNVLIATSLT